jgi:hypothetical protein
MKKYPSVFHLIAGELERAEVPFMVIGGFAVGAYGYPRFTRDFDILMTDAGFLKARPFLESAGYRVETHQKLVAGLSYEEKNPNFIPVDVVFADRETFEGILKSGKQVDVFGVRFTIPSLEHLIAMKLHAIKNNPKRGFQDLTDLVEMVKKNRIDVNSPKFRDLFLKYGTDEWYRKVVESVVE